MKARILGAIAGILIAQGAHADERMFQPVPSASQQVRFEDGRAILFEQTPRALVMVTFMTGDKKSGTVFVGVKNVSDTAFNIAETSVTASAAGQPLAVLSYADRVKAQQSRQRWDKFGAALAAGAAYSNASSAGNEYRSGSYASTTNASVYGQGAALHGNAQTTGTYSGSNYNALAAQQAQARSDTQTQAMYENQQAQQAAEREGLAAGALKANTVDPGELIAGDVQFSLPKPSKRTLAEFTLQIDVAGRPVSILYREQ